MAQSLPAHGLEAILPAQTRQTADQRAHFFSPKCRSGGVIIGVVGAGHRTAKWVLLTPTRAPRWLRNASRPLPETDELVGWSLGGRGGSGWGGRGQKVARLLRVPRRRLLPPSEERPAGPYYLRHSTPVPSISTISADIPCFAR